MAAELVRDAGIGRDDVVVDLVHLLLDDPRLHEDGGGWSRILSDLKTLLETGASPEA